MRRGEDEDDQFSFMARRGREGRPTVGECLGRLESVANARPDRTLAVPVSSNPVHCESASSARRRSVVAHSTAERKDNSHFSLIHHPVGSFLPSSSNFCASNSSIALVAGGPLLGSVRLGASSSLVFFGSSCFVFLGLGSPFAFEAAGARFFLGAGVFSTSPVRAFSYLLRGARGRGQSGVLREVATVAAS